jgi:hypothetical protein
MTDIIFVLAVYGAASLASLLWRGRGFIAMLFLKDK